MGHSGAGALLTAMLVLTTAAANEVSQTPQSPPIPEPCPTTVEWSSGRQAAERGIESGEHRRIEKMADASLATAVKQYWRARLRGDVAGLLELEISQSDDHLAIEARYFTKLLAEDARLHSETWRVAPYSFFVDETNSAHVWVYSTTVLRIQGQCVEDGILTEWVLFDGDWSTLPRGQKLFNAAKKGRPNRGYIPE